MAYSDGLIIGSVENIISALNQSTWKFVSGVPKLYAYPEIIVKGDTTELDELHRRCQAERDQFTDPRQRDAILCKWQIKEYGMDAAQYILSTNMYGYCVGESLHSNIGGGRWSQTPRGYTLEDAIRWGCEQTKKKNVTFHISLKYLPTEVLNMLGIV